MPKVTILVKDKGGAESPIDKARVFIKGPVTQNPETGADGRTSVELSRGKYNIQVEAFGVQAEDKNFNVADQPIEKTFALPVGVTCTANQKKQRGVSAEDEFKAGDTVILRATPDKRNDVNYAWSLEAGSLLEEPDKQNRPEVHWDTSNLRGIYAATVTVSEKGSASITAGTSVTVMPSAGAFAGTVPVTLHRTANIATADLPLWVIIRKSSEALQFANYQAFMDVVLCGKSLDSDELKSIFDPTELKVIGRKEEGYKGLKSRRFLPYTDTDAYRLLKVATEAFLIVNCGVWFTDGDAANVFTDTNFPALNNLVTVDPPLDASSLTAFFDQYRVAVNGVSSKILPYLAFIRRKLPDVDIKAAANVFGEREFPEDCYGILQAKLTNPCLIELIWSYWHEQGMLVQTLNAISARFQNVRTPIGRDPLANLEIDPLRPLNNLLWGYIQDEQHRLSVLRRVYEYDHHYGLTLQGKAVPPIRTADSRSKFLEAFHNLLYVSWLFFKEDDDTTVLADGFPVLNALKEVHLLLSEGAHNQFGDLPETARVEMLMQQWLLARPEFREYLPTRIMVAYPEPWMDRVDSMKSLQSWTDVSILHFSNLGIFGERILLSIRFGAWSTVNDPAQAANWARFWRAEIQNYVHAYRAVTSVDLTAEVTEARQAALRSAQPALLLQQRLVMQRQRLQMARSF